VNEKQHVAMEPQARLDEIITRLREYGHRITPQRMAVIRTLIHNSGHMSIERVYDQVKADFPMTSLSTIYKTTTLLKEMGELIELSIPNSGSYYDCLNPFPHPHLVCNNCSSIIDVDVGSLSDLPQKVSMETGYQITSHRLDFFGICPQCQQNLSSNT
jgi:Fur family peroxide stress response transcriptional regulator